MLGEEARRARGRLSGLLGPLRLLFHDRFITAIVIPFMQALVAA